MLLVRYLVALMAMVGLMIDVALRTSMSTVIVAMTKASVATLNQTVSAESPFLDTNVNGSSSFNASTWVDAFNWDIKTEGLILGSFSIGFIVSQVPGGYMTRIISVKTIMLICVGASSVLTLLHPICIRWNTTLLVVLRVFMGLVQGPGFPTLATLVSCWAPDKEKNTMMTFFFLGPAIASIATPAATVFLMTAGIAGGWPFVFYTLGGVGLCFCILWAIFVTSCPENHPFISEKELNYIKSNINVANIVGKDRSVPWCKLLKSTALWVTCFNLFTSSFPQVLLSTDLPQFFRALKLPLHLNGIYNSVVHIPPLVVPPLFLTFIDFIVHKQWLTNTKVKKLYLRIGGIIGSVCLAAIPLAGYNHLTVIILITAILLTTYLTRSTLYIIVVEIAPNFTGTVMGICNLISEIMSAVLPLIIGAVIKKKDALAEWNPVFYSIAAVYLLGNITFTFWGTADPQPWGNVKDVTKH